MSSTSVDLQEAQLYEVWQIIYDYHTDTFFTEMGINDDLLPSLGWPIRKPHSEHAMLANTVFWIL